MNKYCIKCGKKLTRWNTSIIESFDTTKICKKCFYNKQGEKPSSNEAALKGILLIFIISSALALILLCTSSDMPREIDKEIDNTNNEQKKSKISAKELLGMTWSEIEMKGISLISGTKNEYTYIEIVAGESIDKFSTAGYTPLIAFLQFSVETNKLVLISLHYDNEHYLDSEIIDILKRKYGEPEVELFGDLLFNEKDMSISFVENVLIYFSKEYRILREKEIQKISDDSNF